MFNTQVLAANIKMYRKAKGISQCTLASVLSVSPQSVSKWECGISVPDIENLCMISEILGVSLDVLLSHSKESKKVMIGIDGGGTKTEFIMFNEDGAILERFMAGPCNPNSIGIKACTDMLVEGINALFAANPAVCGIYVGAAGFLLGNNVTAIRNTLKQRYPHVKINCATDMLNAVASATDAENCISVICGTGMAVLVKEGEKLTRLGGYGYLLDGAGSGYDIGRDAIRQALLDMDGMGNKTLITELVKEKAGGEVSEIIDKVYKNGQSFIASLAGSVFEAYEKGDATAELILDENAKRLAEIINHAAKNYNCGNKLILSGGIVGKNSAFVDFLKKHIDKELNVIIPEYPQVLGACVICAKNCGVNTDGLAEKLAKQY